MAGTTVELQIVAEIDMSDRQPRQWQRQTLANDY
jgi:hypothetical protein